jgi:WD40 repeat protein
MIYSIAITRDDKHLWTSGYERDGHVKQFLVSGGQMIKDYGPIFQNYGVFSITTTPDNKWLFAVSRAGHLKQISLESQQVVHDYGQIHDATSQLETTRDSKWLITGSQDKHVKRISVNNRKVDKDFSQVCGSYITRIKITADGEKLLVGDIRGH